jgi:hypothetical protein
MAQPLVSASLANRAAAGVGADADPEAGVAVAQAQLDAPRADRLDGAARRAPDAGCGGDDRGARTGGRACLMIKPYPSFVPSREVASRCTDLQGSARCSATRLHRPDRLGPARLQRGKAFGRRGPPAGSQGVGRRRGASAARLRRDLRGRAGALRSAYDKAEHRVELTATVSEAVADAFENAKALQAEGSSVVVTEIAGARFVSHYHPRIVERVRLAA